MLPTADVPIEGAGVAEHGAHIRDIGNVPGIEVLIKGACAVEHAIHSCDIAVFQPLIS